MDVRTNCQSGVVRKEGSADFPDFVTHYYLPGRAPFMNLSELDETALWDVIQELQELRRAGRNQRMFGRTYMAWRKATEAKLHRLFVDVGGRPERSCPHYFVLGTCRWYEQLAPGTQSIALPLSSLPAHATSFTYPDSFAAMGLGPDFGQPYHPQPYHGRVYLLDELAHVVQDHGLPDDAPDSEYEGYHLRPLEKYIEVQLWSDEPVRQFFA